MTSIQKEVKKYLNGDEFLCQGNRRERERQKKKKQSERKKEREKIEKI